MVSRGVIFAEMMSITMAERMILDKEMEQAMIVTSYDTIPMPYL